MLLKCAAATPPKTAAGRRPYSSRQRRDNGPDGSTWCGAGDETQSPKIRLLAVPATASYAGSGHRVKAMLLHSPPGPLALHRGGQADPQCTQLCYVSTKVSRHHCSKMTAPDGMAALWRQSGSANLKFRPCSATPASRQIRCISNLHMSL